MICVCVTSAIIIVKIEAETHCKPAVLTICVVLLSVIQEGFPYYYLLIILVSVLISVYGMGTDDVG